MLIRGLQYQLLLRRLSILHAVFQSERFPVLFAFDAFGLFPDIQDVGHILEAGVLI